MADIVPPGGTVGIIGGGQLGRMLAVAAARLGLKCVILEPAEDCPAAQVSWRQLNAAYDDPDALKALAELCDVVTYEFENVPVSALDALKGKVPVFPGAKALTTSQDRLLEKKMFSRLGIRTALFQAIDSEDELKTAINDIGLPAILKTRRFGYDGKGQVWIGSLGQSESAMQEINHAPAILEGLVLFEREISIIVARSQDGQIVPYEIAENVHRNHVLHTSTVPANIKSKSAKWALDSAAKLANELDYVGVMALELFVTANDEIVANEIAPRVHNSGHWTQDAAKVDQFEQHIRAVCGWPLGNPIRHSDVVMTNLIGREVDNWQEFSSDRDSMVHLYGKAEARPGRKMGHINRIRPKAQ